MSRLSERSALVLVIALFGAVCTRQEKTMPRPDEKDPPVAHDVPVAGPAAPPAAPRSQGGPEQSKPFVDDGQSSRVSAALGDPKGWKSVWNTGLDETYPYQHVLAAGPRVLLVGRANPRWQLLDDAGRSIALGGLVSGDVLLDGGSRLFYLSSLSGSLEAHSSVDGKLAWRSLLAGAGDAVRVLVARRDNLLIGAAFMPMNDPHSGAVIPLPAAVEVHALRTPEEIRDGYLVSFDQRAHRDTMAVRLQAVIAGDTLIVAVAGLVTFGGLDLGETATYTGGTFEPLALSADVDHGAFLVVRDGGRRALWHLSHAGKRTAAHLLPDDGMLLAPPVIGADGTAHVLVGDRVLAFSDAGPRWSRQLPGLAGAIATADGKLLAAAGSNVIALDGTGAMAIVHSVGDEKLVTAPLLTRGGRILVASAQRLYALQK